MSAPARYRETLGIDVKWYPKSERWRIEVAGSPTLQAVFIAHSTLVGITAVDTYDPDVVAGLIQIHRDAIEDTIAVAKMEGWPDKLGLLPHSIHSM
jgi:hypothetical protein